MTLSYVGNSAAVAVTTSGVPAYPASLRAGDFILMWVTSNVTGIGTPPTDKWAEFGSGTSGGGMFCRAFYRISDGTETGTETVSAAGIKGEAHMSAFRSTRGPVTLKGHTFATDTNSASTVWSATGSAISTAVNDWIVQAATMLAPSGTYSASTLTPSMTQAGATITYTARFGARTGTNTVLFQHGDAVVTAGGTGAPTHSGTSQGANAAGVALFVVLGEQASPILHTQVARRRAANW